MQNPLDVIIAEAGVATYGRTIRSAVRALWAGVFDIDQFYDAMYSAIRMGLTGAWHAGAKECGILPSELSPQERDGLQRAISEELSHILDFADAIEAGSKANGGKLKSVLGRAKLWTMRWEDLSNRAKTMACADQKLKWGLGHTEEHCTSCSRLDGKVKRASYWESRGVHPQSPPNPMLECGGWQCGCTLTKTEEPCSRGPLPRLP